MLPCSQPGRASTEIGCDERHLNPHGSVHGAVVFALIDTGMGAPTMTVIEPRLCARRSKSARGSSHRYSVGIFAQMCPSSRKPSCGERVGLAWRHMESETSMACYVK